MMGHHLVSDRHQFGHLESCALVPDSDLNLPLVSGTVISCVILGKVLNLFKTQLYVIYKIEMIIPMSQCYHDD